MTKALLRVAITAFIVALAAVAYFAVRHDVLSEADRQATLRALSKFHVEYLSEKRIDRDDYLTRLRKESAKNPWNFEEYVRDVENQP